MTEPNNPSPLGPDPWAGAVLESVITINRQRLLRHLQRLRFAYEVVLEGQLQCTATETSRGVRFLSVHTPGLPEIEPLPTAVGVRLDILLKTLNCLEGG